MAGLFWSSQIPSQEHFGYPVTRHPYNMTKLSNSAVLNFEKHIHTVCLLKQFLISDLVKPVDIDVKYMK